MAVEEVISTITDLITSSFGSGAEASIREDVVAKDQPRIEPHKVPEVRQKVREPEEPDFDSIAPEMLPDIPDSLLKDFWSEGMEDDFSMSVKEMEANAKLQEQMDTMEVQNVADQKAVQTSFSEAKRTYMKQLKGFENPKQKGLTETPQGKRYMPIDSGEGKTKNNPTGKEIGFGIVIRPEWLSKDKSKWPVIENVPVDVSKGITEHQANTLYTSFVEDAYKVASKKLKGFEELTPYEQMFWTDGVYNGGDGFVAHKNPKAMKAYKEGYTVEAMLKVLDFIGKDPNLHRGLLRRRINFYNQAALEISGAPVIESYTMGDKIRVKFAYRFMTDKVSDKFKKMIEKNKGYMDIKKSKGKSKVYSMNDKYMFEA